MGEQRKNAGRRPVVEAPRRQSQARAATRLRACVVIAGLRGFDQLSAHLEPKRVVALLQEFVGAMADVAVAHRAVIDAVAALPTSAATIVTCINTPLRRMTTLPTW